MPSNVPYAFAQTASGLIIPRANGFANRIILRTPGAFSLPLPPWADRCKIVTFGAGGGGALTGFYNTSTSIYGAPGGAGGGYAHRIAASVAGMTISGTIGAPGLGGSWVQTSGQPGNFQAAGNNGGTTTVTLNGVTMSATGGQGGPIGTGSESVPATGGIGLGGDFNAAGGAGGHIPSGSGSNLTWVPLCGGGASGSPRGKGGRGGRATRYGFSDGNYNYYLAGCGGGGWGGDGPVCKPAGGSTYQNVHSTGGGTFGPGADLGTVDSASVTGFPGGKGAAPWTVVASYTGTYPYSIMIPTEVPWWDFDDVVGWGGGYTRYPNFNPSRGSGGVRNGGALQSIAQDGQDGGGGSSHTSPNYPIPGGCGGWGGGSGGGGVYMDANIPLDSYQNPSPGGVGGGGGGTGFTWQGGRTVRASDGGEGAVVVYF